MKNYTFFGGNKISLSSALILWVKQLGTETSAGFTAFQYKMFKISHLNTGFKFSFKDHREYKQHMDYCVTWDLNIKCFQIFFHLDNWIFKILLCIVNGIIVNSAFCHSKHILSALLHLIRLNTQENSVLLYEPHFSSSYLSTYEYQA